MSFQKCGHQSAHLCSPYTFPKGVVAPSQRCEAWVVHVECWDTAIIPRMFLVVRLENPSYVLFCVLQDYLVVTAGSLVWFGDAVFPGCPRQAGWPLENSPVEACVSAFQGQKWSPVVLQSHTRECSCRVAFIPHLCILWFHL